MLYKNLSAIKKYTENENSNVKKVKYNILMSNISNCALLWKEKINFYEN